MFYDRLSTEFASQTSWIKSGNDRSPFVILALDAGIYYNVCKEIAGSMLGNDKGDKKTEMTNCYFDKL